MNNLTKAIILMPLIAASARAGAAPLPAPSSDQMARCAAIQARDTRLSCYDALAHRPPDEAPAVAATAPAAPAPTIPATPSAPVPATQAAPAHAPATVAAVVADPKNFGLTATQTHIADLGPKSEAAHISILSSDQTGQMFVVLDSGQTWTVLDPDGWLSTGDAVTIKRANFGSYLMFAPSHHSYRVRRIK
jgi:hypothetical protein